MFLRCRVMQSIARCFYPQKSRDRSAISALFTIFINDIAIGCDATLIHDRPSIGKVPKQ